MITSNRKAILSISHTIYNAVAKSSLVVNILWPANWLSHPMAIFDNFLDCKQKHSYHHKAKLKKTTKQTHTHMYVYYGRLTSV